MCFERFCEHHFLGGKPYTHTKNISWLNSKIKCLTCGFFFFIIKNLLGLTDLLVSIFDILKIS